MGDDGSRRAPYTSPWHRSGKNPAQNNREIQRKPTATGFNDNRLIGGDATRVVAQKSATLPAWLSEPQPVFRSKNIRQSLLSSKSTSEIQRKPTATRFNDNRLIGGDATRVVAQKSATLPAWLSEPQPVFRSKNIRQSLSSSKSTSVNTGLSNGSRFPSTAGPSRLVNPQHEGSVATTHSYQRTSYPLLSPLNSNHRARTHVRKTATPQKKSTGSPSVIRTPTITASVPDIFPVKSSSTPVPFWHFVDNEREKERPSKRPLEDDRPPAGFDFVKRVATTSSHRYVPPVNHRARGATSSQNRPKVYLGPNMKLKVEGEPDDSDSPMDEDQPPRRNPIQTKQTGLKAARKREWPQRAPLFDPDETSAESEQSGPETSDEEEDELDELDSDAGEPETDDQQESDDGDIEEIIKRSRRSYTPPQIIFPSPRRVKNLPQTPPPEVLHPPQSSSTEPSAELVVAIEALTLSSVRMQKTKQLPFMIRNLRRGFLQRCFALGISTKPGLEPISVVVRYEGFFSTGEHTFETRMEEWVCPLCELHGAFRTREMLASHLGWDHEGVHVHWEHMQDRTWLLRIGIHETQAREQSVRITHEAMSSVNRQLETEHSLSPFPFVALSPPETRPSEATRTHTDSPTPLSPVPLRHTARLLLSTPAPTLSSLTPLASSFRGSSMATTTSFTLSTEKTPRPSRYPTPPPATNPLGPAAQPPYLPAKSEYGGPDIYYSCRPAGACLYDLLDTLPLEPFGVLAWDILDREDEIYDSDNVKDEYKVMHALWARWIVLNRNKFIADYYKGTIAFVDTYWRMIHRAAGWDALRYWLLMLLANRFINGGEVAKVLKHYESLTGMDSWYD